MFFHTFSLTCYFLYSFQELQVTLPILLNKKFYSVGLELLMFFAVVKSTANRDDRGRGRGLAVAVRRGRNLDRGTSAKITIHLKNTTVTLWEVSLKKFLTLKRKLGTC